MDWRYQPGELNTIQFADLNSSDIKSIKRQGDDLILDYATAKNPNDQLTLRWYHAPSGNYNNYQIKFLDNTTWTKDDLLNNNFDLNQLKLLSQPKTPSASSQQSLAPLTLTLASPLSSASGNDLLTGADSSNNNSDNKSDTFKSEQNNNAANTRQNNDLRIAQGSGGALESTTSDDINLLDKKITGAANNPLSTRTGNTITVVFGRGDGHYVAEDFYNSAYFNGISQNSRLELKPGVSPQDLDLSYQGKDLTLKIRGTNDAITLKNYFQGSDPRVSGGNIFFADGFTSWDDNYITHRLLDPQNDPYKNWFEPSEYPALDFQQVIDKIVEAKERNSGKKARPYDLAQRMKELYPTTHLQDPQTLEPASFSNDAQNSNSNHKSDILQDEQSNNTRHSQPEPTIRQTLRDLGAQLITPALALINKIKKPGQNSESLEPLDSSELSVGEASQKQQAPLNNFDEAALGVDLSALYGRRGSLSMGINNSGINAAAGYNSFLDANNFSSADLFGMNDKMQR